jgi:hypothetical protein
MFVINLNKIYFTPSPNSTSYQNNAAFFQFAHVVSIYREHSSGCGCAAWGGTFGSGCRRRCCSRVPLATFGRDSERDVRNAVTACRADGRTESRCMTRARAAAECRFNVYTYICAMRDASSSMCITTGSEPQRGCVFWLKPVGGY